MSQLLEWSGNARGQIYEFGIFEADSGAVAITVKAKVHAWYDADKGQWIDCMADELESSGSIWIVKRDGKPIPGNVESLCQHAGWNGDLGSVADGTWQPTQCSFVINEEEYKDQVSFKISFLNAYDRTPGAVGNVTAKKARALQDRFGSQFRAIAGNVKQAAAVPNGKPPAPKPSAKRGPVRNEEPAVQVGDTSDIPF